MTRRVLYYPLAMDPQQIVRMPKYAQFRHITVLNGQIRMYMEVDESQPVVEHLVTTVPAGVNLDPGNGPYVGHYLLPARYSPLKKKGDVVGLVYLTEAR